MKVLILGATGFVALPVAQAFSRAGHIVYGVTRSQSSADRLLAPEEIIPVVCDSSTDEGRKVWGAIAATCDVVIDTVPAYGPEVPRKSYEHVVSLAKSRERGAKLTYIFTGGLWSLSAGPGGLDKWTDERQPDSGQIKLTAWRKEVQDDILSNEAINGIVIRLPVVYGRNGSFVAMLIFNAAHQAAQKQDKFEALVGADTRWGTIHHDDAADLYLRVAERAPICRGHAFAAVNPLTERATDVLDAVVRVSGAKGYNMKLPDKDNAFEAAWTSTTNLKASLGYALTGWVPRKMGLVDGMDVYWRSFVASLKQE